MDPEASRDLMGRLRADAARIAARFELRYRALEAERPHVNGHYGICFDDGTIRIRLQHATSGRPLKYSSLVNTLCHELAHLRHFDHGPRFRAFYLKLLDWARSEDIYRPRLPGAAATLPQAAPALPGSPRPPPGGPKPPPGGPKPPPGGPKQLDLFS